MNDSIALVEGNDVLRQNRGWLLALGVVMMLARKLLVFLPALVFAALVAGCTTMGPEYLAPALNPPIQWSGETGSRMSSDPLDPASLNQWWTTLRDPVLTRPMNRALAIAEDQYKASETDFLRLLRLLV